MPQDKFNTKDELMKNDALLQGSHSMLGRTILTIPQYNNSTRSNMNTSHQQQLKNLITPDSPGFFTNGENLVGKYSSGYKKVKNKSTVYRIIKKFEDLVEEPTIYKFFYFDEVEKTYKVMTRTQCENLAEVFGYEYDNSVIDKFEEGDIIKPNTVMYRSRSYDDHMNYGYGRDIRVMYSLETFTTEDALVLSEEVNDIMQSMEAYTFSCGINDNDFPLNLYGDDEEYKSLPDIGEPIKNGIAFATRRKYNNQVLHDFKNEMLTKVLSTDRKFYMEGKVVDIVVYCNNEDLERNTFNAQIYDYLMAQDKYYTEIIQTCEDIFKSGYEYSDDIDYLYKRALEFVDRKKKWTEKDSSFSNLKIFVTVEKRHAGTPGQKYTGRYGNKSVTAQIRKKEDMPYYYNHKGEKVYIQMILSLLAIINRTTGGPIFEIATNFISRKVSEQMQQLETKKEREDLLWDYIGEFNPKQRTEMKRKYDSLSVPEQEEYLDYCMNVKIHCNQPPAWDTEDPIFYRLSRITDKYDFIKPDTMYIRKWSREIKCMRPSYIGNMYMLMLKQTSKKGFSARGTGAINTKELPERSYKSKKYMEKVSSTAIRFGESESLNFCIGMMPEELALFHAFYRTSVDARSDMAKAILRNEPLVKVKKTYTNRAAEILSVIMKSLSYEIEFYNEDQILEEFDTNTVKEFHDGAQTYICTDYEFYMIQRAKEIMDDILDEYGVLEEDELRSMILDVMKEKSFINGDFKESQKFLLSTIKIPEPENIEIDSETLKSQMESIEAEPEQV